MSNQAAKTQATPAKEKTLNKRELRAEQQLTELRVTAEHMFVNGKAQEAFALLLGAVASLQRDNERLTYRLMAAHRARYGRQSERLTAEQLGQLVLALGGTEQEAAAAEPNVPAPSSPIEQVGVSEASTEAKTATENKKKRKHPGRSSLDPDLPRKIHFVPVAEDERKCLHCGETMTCIGHVDHESIEFVPAQILVNVTRREKLACKKCEQDITTAERPVIPQGERRAGFSLLAHLIEAKIDDALPIHRQRDQLRRLGFNVPVNTLYSYWDYAAGLLVPVAEVILSKVLGEAVVGIDDTRLDYLDLSAPHGRYRGHLWCFVGSGPLVGFAFTETWCAEDVAPWLWAAEGFIQCDDYKGYAAKILDGDKQKRILVPPELRLGCLMHVRRRFYIAFVGGHKAAAVPIGLIKSIYEVEEEAKSRGLGAPERHELRQVKSLPILDEFDAWVDTHRETFLPKSPLNAAVRYAHEQRDFVRRCFSDGRFEIDNGRVERQIREVAVGRRNYLFSGSAEGARRLAAAYAVVLSARNAGLCVREYLIDILGKLAGGWKARRIGELVPGEWKPSATASSEQAA